VKRKYGSCKRTGLGEEEEGSARLTLIIKGGGIMTSLIQRPKLGIELIRDVKIHCDVSCQPSCNNTVFDICQ